MPRPGRKTTYTKPRQRVNLELDIDTIELIDSYLNNAGCPFSSRNEYLTNIIVRDIKRKAAKS